ncbi:MAG: citrate synthase [Alphaproteobacteria bacterium]
MRDGLDEVVVTATELSAVDGGSGRLIVRGADIEDLAGRTSYEAMAERLWAGLAPAGPTAPESTPLGTPDFGPARLQAWRLAPDLLRAARGLPPVDGLRAGLALLPDGADAHVRVCAAIPVFAAALSRQARGLAPVPPDPTLGQAADFLRMLHDKAPETVAVAALETYLVTIADHGMNASTFAARVIASTRAGVVAAVVGALCALQGRLHGGAPGPVLDMLDAIGSEEAIGPWIEGALDRGERLMGFGHRVYRSRDPRADILKGVVQRLAAQAPERIALAAAVEQAALAALGARHPDRALATNVEFYTALALEALAIPRDLFTPTFALGRALGWCAHAFEQTRGGRLIRPQSRYVGPWPVAAA